MLATYRRHSVVVVLVVLSGLLGIAARPQLAAPALPPIASLLHDTGWRVDRADPLVSYTGSTYGDWMVSGAQGGGIQLYVAADSLQKMIHWSGELGYDGAGYTASNRATTTVRLRDGTSAPVSVVVERNPTDRAYVAYATVSRDYIAAHAGDNLLRTGWDVVRGANGPYYVVRVSVPSPTAAFDPFARKAAADLLGPILSTLAADARQTHAA